MTWAKDELKRFHEAIPAALWNIEDLKPTEQLIRGTRQTFHQGDAKIVVYELVSTLADAITASGLGLFGTDENSRYGIRKTLENHDYSSYLAHQLAELIQRHLPFDL